MNKRRHLEVYECKSDIDETAVCVNWTDLLKFSLVEPKTCSRRTYKIYWIPSSGIKIKHRVVLFLFSFSINVAGRTCCARCRDLRVPT